MKTQQVVIFDLDDTLYKEIDFLKSAYREIAAFIGHPEAYDFMLDRYREGENVFECVIKDFKLPYTIEQLLAIYRNHKPTITLDTHTTKTLNELKGRDAKMGLMTDGRSVTQHNKIETLGLGHWIEPDDILISEEFGHGKPSIECYQYFMRRYPHANFTVVGDNPIKDFVTANRLGWKTVGLLDNGQNIFRQDIQLPQNYQPRYTIKDIGEILELV